MAAVKSGKGKANSATPPGRKPGMTEKQHRDKQDKLAKAKSDNSSNKPPVKVTAASSSNSAPSSSPSSLAPAATVVAQKVVAAAQGVTYLAAGISKDDAAAQPAQGITIFKFPLILRPHFACDSCPFLRPSKDMKFKKDSVYAVRGNEKYQSISAMFFSERSYVRDAMLHAGRIVFYSKPGENPIVVLSQFEELAITGAVGTRAVDLVATRTTTVLPHREKSITIKIPEVKKSEATRVVRIVADSEAIAKLASHADAAMSLSIKDSHVEGVAIATATLTEKNVQDVRSRGFLAMPLEDIVGDEKNECKFTVRFNSDTPVSNVLAAGKAIQDSFKGAAALFRTYNALRVTMLDKLTAETLNQIKTLTKAPFLLPDHPVNAWSTPKAARPTTEEDAPAAQGKIKRILRANFLCTAREITEVAKQLQAEIHSTVSSKYTDVAMSTVVVFDSSLGDHVAQLDASSITIGTGKVFYLCLPNMV